MATEIQPEKPLEVMMTNLKVDPSSGVNSSTKIAAKSGGSSDVASCISASGDATSLVKGSDVDQEPLNATEQSMYYYPPGGYYGYHYPGFDGSFAGEWDEGGYFLGSEGLEGQYSAVQGENGSVIYYMPGFQFGYNPYGSYAPGTMISTDGQYFGQQQLVPSAVYPQPLAYQGYYTSPISYGSEVFSTYPLEASPTYGEGAHGNGFGVVPTVVSATKPNFSSTHVPAKVTPPSKFSNPSEKDSSPLLDFPPSNPSMKPANKNGSNFPAATVLAKGYFPIPKFHGKSGELLSSNGSLNSAKANGQGWVGEEKLKARGKAGGISDINLLNEQNRGPRTHGAKNTLVSCIDPVGSENSGKTNNSSLIIKRDLYNLPDFPGRYEHALFYVIKSYSEDDIHKSIKYSVWASTPNGNKRLDGAYQDAQQKMEESGAKCPVFLFFSVNASGQFCGVAEMMGRVDFNKNMDFWQQDKWNGFFPVKWHIIKDVPNPQFRHMLLVNNENKPVTNSRDTQEVKFHHGIEMLDIFKNYSAKTCILDDFEFYESRQKVMQDKRSRPVTPCLEHMQFAEKKHDGYIQLAKPGEMKYDVGCRPSPEFTYVKRNKEEVEAGRKLKD